MDPFTRQVLSRTSCRIHKKPWHKSANLVSRSRNRVTRLLVINHYHNQGLDPGKPNCHDKSIDDSDSFCPESPAGENPSLVHPVVTSARCPIPTDYKAYRTINNESEMRATEKLYRDIDLRDSKTRSLTLGCCRSLAWFAWHEDSKAVKVLSNSCRLRWCPICSSVRHLQIRDTVKDWINSVNYPKFLTLTFKHSTAPLVHQITELYKFFRLLRQRKEFRDKVTGGVWFFQIVRSKTTGEWHPHIHCIISGEYISQRRLSSMWLSVTKTSSIVDIRKIRDENEIADYVSRYCARPAALSKFKSADRIEIHDALHGRRLCGTWGNGNVMSFRHGQIEDKHKWHILGRYGTIIKNMQLNSRSKAIVKAWNEHKALPFILKFSPLEGDMQKWCTLELPDIGYEDLELDGGFT